MIEMSWWGSQGVKYCFCFFGGCIFSYTFCTFGKIRKEGRFFVFFRVQTFSLELRAGKTHRQFFDNQRNVVRLPDNHERLLQKTRGQFA